MMDKLSRFFKSKIVLFSIQITIISLLIFIFNYRSNIIFDTQISQVRKDIIQFLANYVIFVFMDNDFSGFIYIFISWTIVSLIPILVYNNFKKAWSMNITSFFFPNFFFYVFYSRYSEINSKLVFPSLFSQTILLGLYIVGLSIGLSLGLKKVLRPKDEVKIEDLKVIEDMTKSRCPFCGTEFNSIPKYCYNCSREIISKDLDGVK